MKTPPSPLVGVSSATRDIDQEIDCAARSDTKVLITGESGVGKEVVARLIHERSHRNSGPIVTINCAGIPDSLLESELFGHTRGSFTDAYRDKMGWLEQAQGGTIFMDEVGEMSLRMQALLLRFLENGEIQRVGSSRAQSLVGVRVITATNRNLMAEIAEKNFREDLYYRLNVIHVAIPPLRERRDDVPCLFAHFVRHFSKLHRLDEPRVSEDAMAKFCAYDWPGNVRELKNVAERLVVRTSSGVIEWGDLPREIRFGPNQATSQTSASSPEKSTADLLLRRMTVGGESFWAVVYEPFMSRDLTRQTLRDVVRQGLELTRGSYKMLLQVFNLDPQDYKRLLSFLRKYDCHMPFQPFRSLPAHLGGSAMTDEPVAFRRSS
jgi:DNA-binding NtrC family response regulator